MSGHLTVGSGEDGFGVQGSGSGVEGSGSGVEGSGSGVEGSGSSVGSGSGVEGWISKSEELSESEELRGSYRLYSLSSRRGAIDSDSDRSLETLKRVLLLYFIFKKCIKLDYCHRITFFWDTHKVSIKFFITLKKSYEYE